jgi:hypothetical protein
MLELIDFLVGPGYYFDLFHSMHHRWRHAPKVNPFLAN